MAQELTTLTAVKDYLGLKSIAEDILLTRLIAAASAFLLGEMNRESMDAVYPYVKSYAQVPGDVDQACVEMVALKYKEKDRLGETSKNIGGQVVSYSQKDMPSWVRDVVKRYRRVTP